MKAARRTTHRRGFTLIEAGTAAIVLGLLAGATLKCVSLSSTTWAVTAARARARQLAADLMTEVCAQSYKESNSSAIGTDFGESASGSRLNLDDVDDYDGLVEKPPVQMDGSAIPEAAAWKRSTTVVWVAAPDLATAVNYDTGLKLITITVSEGNKILAKATSLRTVAWDKANWTGKTSNAPATVTAATPKGP